jgi:Protein of unknown function (DUF2914)
MKQYFDQVKAFSHKHKKWEPLAFFTAGFTFDALLLHRIDDPLMLTHQFIYLCLSAFIISWDLLSEGREVVAGPKWISKVWSYREGILHFLLGTLLNVYTIFYFKSGTFLSSFIFLLILAALLYLNEVRPPKISKHLLRNALFGLCLISYMNIIVSIILGSIGIFIFMLAIATAILIHSALVHYLAKRLPPNRVKREIRLPFFGVAVLYVLLYLFKVLPPVPLSVKHMGIYHTVEKENGFYKLGYTRPSWKFWESGDQTFEANPGDKIFCFIQVFSPSRFKDQLFVRWQYDDPRSGWTNADAIPLGVVGGREEGFRGMTSKSNYTPGDWRVSVETSDGRQIGRLGFTVKPASNPSPSVTYEFH